MATATWEQRPNQAREGGGEITMSKRTTSEELKGQAITMKALIQDQDGSPVVLDPQHLVGHAAIAWRSDDELFTAEPFTPTAQNAS